MSNESIIIELLGNGGDPVRGTVNNADTFTKGQIMAWEDPRKLSGSLLTTGVQIPAGIACADKVAADGSTTLAVYTNGIFGLKLNTDACLIGDMVTISGANMIGVSGVGTKYNLGKSLEAGATGDVVAVRVLL